MIARQRPKYLDLRISGTALFVFAWALLYLLQESLRSPESHAHFAALTSHWLVKLFLIGMLWSFLHHFCAGLRHLLLDIQVAGDLGPARATSFAVLAISLVVTAILGVMLW